MPQDQRRGLTRSEAAAYVGVSASRFSQLIKAGTMPAAIPGTHRWDRRALDARLDKLSGLTPTIAPSAYDEWKAGRNAGAA